MSVELRLMRRCLCLHQLQVSSWKHHIGSLSAHVLEVTSLSPSPHALRVSENMRRFSAFPSPIIIEAVVLLTLTFVLSIQRVSAASVTFSASLSRKIPFKYQGDTYQTWVLIHGGVGPTLNRPLCVRLCCFGFPCSMSLRSAHGYTSVP